MKAFYQTLYELMNYNMPYSSWNEMNEWYSDNDSELKMGVKPGRIIQRTDDVKVPTD